MNNIDRKLFFLKIRLVLFRLFCWGPLVCLIAYTYLSNIAVNVQSPQTTPRPHILHGWTGEIIAIVWSISSCVGCWLGYLVESKNLTSGWSCNLSKKIRKWLCLE